MRFGGDGNGVYGGLTAYSSYSFSNPTFTGTVTSSGAINGAVQVTGKAFLATDTGLTAIGAVVQNTLSSIYGSVPAGFTGASGSAFAWDSTTSAVGGAVDAAMWRAGANSIRYNGAGTSATTTSLTQVQKATTGISNAVATTVLTITIPNAAHSASIEVMCTGSLGAGGAIGANEASATNVYVVTVTRTAGVNAVAAISSAYGAAASAVAGAATVTSTLSLGAVSGAVGATNTIAIQVTITRSGGSSDNHTAVCTARLLNANATGVTIA